MPLSLTGNNASSTSLEMTWQPPRDSNGIITEYRVYLRNSSLTVPIMKPTPTGSNETMLVVRDLAKFTWYRVWVRALTSAGEGPQSNFVDIMTDEDSE